MITNSIKELYQQAISLEDTFKSIAKFTKNDSRLKAYHYKNKRKWLKYRTLAVILQDKYLDS